MIKILKQLGLVLLIVSMIVNMVGCQKIDEKKNPLSQIVADSPSATEKLNKSQVDFPSITPYSLPTYIPSYEPTDINQDYFSINTLNNNEKLFISSNWEDYIGDCETFVYGLMINELKLRYDVFSAMTVLSDGTVISGLGYTDYNDCFINEETGEKYFAVGFIPFKGEFDIPEEEFESGLLVYDLDYNPGQSNLIMQYKSGEYSEHCVAYGQYIKYGVDSYGKIFYENYDFDKELCDEDLGDLYSYDKSRFILRTDFGNYSYITGTALSHLTDYDSLENEINEIIRNQDMNTTAVEYSTYISIAKERVEAYFMNMQSESFLGYDPYYLAELASQIDDDECIRFLEEGFTIIDKNYGQEATTLVKVLVGAACIVTAVVGMVCSVAVMACPPLSALTGAVTGVAIELFMQVVVSGRSLGAVEWSKVGLAAATGAICGFLGPYIFAHTTGLGYFFADSCMDGVMGGLEKGVSAWIDGESGMELVKSIGYGAAMGFGLSAGFKIVGKGIGAAAEKASKFAKTHNLDGLGEKLFPTLTKGVSKLKNFVNNKVYLLKQKVEEAGLHNEYLAKKIYQKQVQRLATKGDDELLDKSIDRLTTNHSLYDKNGLLITKDDIRRIAPDAADGTVLATLEDEAGYVIKKNGVVGIIYESSGTQTVIIKGGLVADRTTNMLNAVNEFKNNWLADPDLIPDSIKAEIAKRGTDSDKLDDILEELTPRQLLEIIRDKEGEWVLHENIDLVSITLVKKSIHTAAEGGAAHYGGFALAQDLKTHMADEFFDRFLGVLSSTAATS